MTEAMENLVEAARDAARLLDGAAHPVAAFNLRAVIAAVEAEAKDAPPEVPLPDLLSVVQADERTRLRDTFAAAALTGLIARGEYVEESTIGVAWSAADSMLAAREGK